MNHMKVARVLLLLLAALLCLVQGARVRGAPDEAEAARQVASAANDDALGLEERQEALKKLEEWRARSSLPPILRQRLRSHTEGPSRFRRGRPLVHECGRAAPA